MILTQVMVRERLVVSLEPSFGTTGATGLARVAFLDDAGSSAA